MTKEANEAKMKEKQSKQFEKDFALLKKYTKEFKMFFGDEKMKASFEVIYSSTFSGFKKNDLYEVIKDKENIMFFFETVTGKIFGCYNSKPIPQPEKYGSKPVEKDEKFFVYSLVSQLDGVTPFTIKQKALRKDKKDITNAGAEVTGMLGNGISTIGSGITTIGTGIGSGLQTIGSAFTGSKDEVEVEKKEDLSGSGTGITVSTAKKDTKTRSLYISSEVNQSWMLETHCCFIVMGDYVSFGSRIGCFYDFGVKPECVCEDDDESYLLAEINGLEEGEKKKIPESLFMDSKINDAFIGCHLPKTVQLKRMIVCQWSFGKK